MGNEYQAMVGLIRTIQTADPLPRAQMATELLNQLDSLTRRAAAVRDEAVHELVSQGGSYASVGESVGVSKALVAKIQGFASLGGGGSASDGDGRSGLDVRRFAALIPRRPLEQSLWKNDVCLRYAHGEPVSDAMARATATRRETNPEFEPLYDPAVLEL